MRQRIAGSLVLASCVLLGGAALFAHHAFDTEFDASKPVTLKGAVTKVEWTNPHVWFYLNVKNDKTGELENWGFEMGGVRQLQEQGWNRNTIQIGSVLVVDGFLARNGSKNANAKSVTLANGQKLGAASSQGRTASQLP